ncbi:hypothetical protein CDIK_1515 [Cucumispora dikerogammari]|nr:hypothetical protein CDIK_1515 [Cucumispora dikerogammari]
MTWETLYIRSLVNANLLITLNAIVLKIQKTFQLPMDYNTFDRCLKQFHYSLKQLVVLPKRRNCENTIETRFKYAKDFLNLTASIENKNLVFLGEEGFSVCSKTKKDRALIS